MTVENVSQNISSLYAQMSSGKRINSAADDAAGLAISEEMSSQETGLNKGSENTADMQNLVRTADAALSGINDSLQRIRELAIQASNGIYSDNDKKIMQEEVDQLKGAISQIVEQTQFNGQKLLDGSFQDKNTASSADGTGQKVSISEMSLEALGIKDLDITGSFDMSSIDNAIGIVSDQRSSLGATDNTMGHTIVSNDITSLNLAASRSRMADADIAKVSTDLSKAKLLQQYQILMQKKQMEQEKSKLNILSL